MRLSVVVTIVDGGETLRRCLAALAAQVEPPDMEVLVPWDDSVAGIQEIQARFPSFRFVAMGHVATERAATTGSGQHELFDRRRAAGLAAATGDVVAILEDRGAPVSEWARLMMAEHARLPHAAIGGAIENGLDRPLAWAVYFCDFGRYQRPFDAGERAYVSDVNVGYKRRALDLTADRWRVRYHETTVHWALQRAGESLYLSPLVVVEQQRLGLRLTDLIRERFVWGRLFAYTRAREQPATNRLVYAALAPVLPAILFARIAAAQASRATFGQFVAVSPLVVVLLTVWSVGEMVGYVTGRP